MRERRERERELRGGFLINCCAGFVIFNARGREAARRG